MIRAVRLRVAQCALETGDSRLYHGWFSIIAVCCATLVVAAVLDPEWPLHRFWRQPWLKALEALPKQIEGLLAQSAAIKQRHTDVGVVG